MTLDEAIKHCEEVMMENFEKTKDRNASDPIAINCFECADEHRQLAEWLKELKAYREQTRWIPVSERLPEENGRYVVYINAKVHLIQIIPFAKNLHEISLDFTSKKAGWYDYDSEYGFFERTGIEAWMPLPEPYKAECEEV